MAFFWAVVIGFGLGKRRSLASLRRHYEAATGLHIEESSFYDRFNRGFASLVRSAVRRVLQAMQGAGSVATQRVAGAFRDLLVMDSTVIRLHRALAGRFAGTRRQSPAAAKLHMVLSVARATAQRVRLTPERVHDTSPWRTIGAWVRGALLLFDRGYQSYWLQARIDDKGGFFVLPVKRTCNPEVVEQTQRGQWRTTGATLRQWMQHVEGDAIDVHVRVVFRRRTYQGRARLDSKVFRVVGQRDAHTGQWRLYLTNIPQDDLDTDDIVAIYRLRWQVEVLFKELKTHYRIDQLPSQKAHIVEALIYAAILTLLVSRILYHAMLYVMGHHRPIPPLRWAAVFSSLVAPHLLHALVPSAPRRTRSSPWEFLWREAIDPNLARYDDMHANGC